MYLLVYKLTVWDFGMTFSNEIYTEMILDDYFPTFIAQNLTNETETKD